MKFLSRTLSDIRFLRAVVLKLLFPHQHHNIMWELIKILQTLSTRLELENPKLWEWDPAICTLASFSKHSDVASKFRKLL